MKYESLEPISCDEAERLIEEGTDVSTVLVRAVHSGHDMTWSLNLCSTVAAMDDPYLQRITATCIGHLGRLRTDLDLDRAREILTELWSTNDPNVRGHVEDALDDIETFRGVRLDLNAH